MTNIFANLQEEIAGRLSADEWFAGTPPIGIVQEILGDIDAEIDTRIKRCGVVVVVTTPRITRGDPNLKGDLAVTVMLGIGEMVRTNRGPTGTRKTAHDIAVSTMALLDQWQPTSSSWRPLQFRDATIVDGPSDMLSWQVIFDTQIRVQASTEEVA